MQMCKKLGRALVQIIFQSRQAIEKVVRDNLGNTQIHLPVTINTQVDFEDKICLNNQRVLLGIDATNFIVFRYKLVCPCGVGTSLVQF